MEWLLYGLDADPIESTTNSNTVLLSPDPNSSELDGAMFTCRVTTSTGHESKTITLKVKGHQYVNSLHVSTIMQV